MKIAVDFDNVLYDHDGRWRGGALPRPPVPGATSPSLTVEAALAIALYAWRTSCNR